MSLLLPELALSLSYNTKYSSTVLGFMAQIVLALTFVSNPFVS